MQNPYLGLIQIVTTDPTVGPGVNGVPWEFLFRADDASLYIKSGPANTAWTLIAAGGGGLPGNLQSFKYVVTGDEPDLSNLVIALPAARLTSTYNVFMGLMDSDTSLGPIFNNRTTTEFTLTLTSDAQEGDIFCFLVIDDAGSGSPISGGGIQLNNDGIPVVGGPFGTINLIPGLSAADAGMGVADVSSAGTTPTVERIGGLFPDPVDSDPDVDVTFMAAPNADQTNIINLPDATIDGHLHTFIRTGNSNGGIHLVIENSGEATDTFSFNSTRASLQLVWDSDLGLWFLANGSNNVTPI